MQTKRKITNKKLNKLITKKLSKLLTNYYDCNGIWAIYDSVVFEPGEYCSPCKVYLFYKIYTSVAKRICCEIDAFDKDKTILLKAFASIIKSELLKEGEQQ